jgi:hypothetical protein
MISDVVQKWLDDTWCFMQLELGVIIIKRTKNHVKRPKNCQFFQRYLCNVILKDFLTLTPQNYEFYKALGWGLF